jgi:FkbM family methyltransferase
MSIYSSFHGEIQNDKEVDKVLREYFPDYNYKGVFLDIGAFEPITISNSYHFEKNGWDVYCFEANTNQIPILKSLRKNVYNYAIYDEDKDLVDFNVVTTHNWTAGFSAVEISSEYLKIFPQDFQNLEIIKVPQKKMNTVLENELPHIKKIDIISLDIEGGELKCLKGFDLKKYEPKIIVVENVNNDKIIYEYLCENGYVLDKQISYNQYYKNINSYK